MVLTADLGGGKSRMRLFRTGFAVHRVVKFLLTGI